MLRLKLQIFGQLMRRADSFWKRPWCWEGLRAREGGDRGWDGWMASLTWWTWVWANSGSWWWTGRPGVLQFMGSQRARHNWATELNWTETFSVCFKLVYILQFLSGEFCLCPLVSFLILLFKLYIFSLIFKVLLITEEGWVGLSQDNHRFDYFSLYFCWII